MEDAKIDTHNLIVEFGKHKGERWTRLPVSYLKWLANESTSGQSRVAKAELDRRGTVVIPNGIEISPHAIDRASTRLKTNFRDDKASSDEGLYSWLVRKATEALPLADSEGKAVSGGIKFVFKKGHIYSTLLTVMPYKQEK